MRFEQWNSPSNSWVSRNANRTMTQNLDGETVVLVKFDRGDGRRPATLTVSAEELRELLDFAEESERRTMDRLAMYYGNRPFRDDDE